MWCAKMHNFQIYAYFSCDSVFLHDTGVGTVPNKQNFASTAKRWLIILYSSFRTLSNIASTPGLHCTAMAKSKVTTIPVHCYTILVSMRVSLFRLTQCSRVGTLMEEITGQRAQESHFHIRCSFIAIERLSHIVEELVLNNFQQNRIKNDSNEQCFRLVWGRKLQLNKTSNLFPQ